MNVLVVGASGATGRLLVGELLERGHQVRVIVRGPEKPATSLTPHPQLEIVRASLLGLRDDELAAHVKDCGAVASCLGHTLSIKGIFGPPRWLVTDAIRRLCGAVRATHPRQPVRFVLMNTAGNRNRGLEEPVSIAQRCVLALLRVFLPPHADNERAADYLRTDVQKNDRAIAWAVVRPDTLVNEENASEYEVHMSPTRSALFDAGKTSRANVAHFMAELITNDDMWKRWQGQMPVIYNKGFSS